MKKFCCVLLFLLSLHVHAQLRFSQSAIGVQTHYGTFLTHSPKAQYLRDSYSYFGEVYFQQQTNGSRAWHHANHLPQWGAGLFWGHTGSRQFMGNMAGAFSFMNLPLLKKRAFTSKLRIGTGLGWVQHPYNKYNNHKNVLIGSSVNAYINFLWQNEMQVAPRIFVNAGFSFSHLSNGGSTLPNLGLNIPAVAVGLRYGAGAPGKKQAVDLPPYNKKLSFSLFAGAGLKQAPWVESRRYLVNALQAEVIRRFSFSGAYGGGVVVYYDPSLEIHPAGVPSLKRENNQVQAGLYAAYEKAFGRLSLPVQLGLYVYNKDKAPLLFQSLGIRYQLASKLTGQILMKTHMGKADHIGFGLGYTLK